MEIVEPITPPFICKRCADCCETYPCNLEPEDIEKIATYLKLSIKEFIKEYLIIDFTERHEHYIIPRRRSDRHNTHHYVEASYDWAWSKSPCTFLRHRNGQSMCKIHNVIPRGGKEYECNVYRSASMIKKQFADIWTSDLGLKLLHIAWNGETCHKERERKW